MPNFVSPGVYVIEKDISDYPPTINSSVVGIVGFADRGPIAGTNLEKATLITSQQQLVDTFGEPNEAITGQALEGSLEILEATNTMRFVRCAGATAVEASAAVSVGGCPAVFVSGSNGTVINWVNGGAVGAGMSAIGSSDNTSSGVRFAVTATDNAGTQIYTGTTTVPSATLTTSATDGASTVLGLKKKFGGSLGADRVGAFGDSALLAASGFLVNLAAGSGATLSITMEITDGAAWYGLSGLQPVNADGGLGTAASSLTVSGTSVDSTSHSYLVKSLWKGSGYNAGTKTDGSTSGVSFEVGVNGGVNTREQVNNLGVAAESFITGATSSAFIEDYIGVDYTNRTSDYITGYFVTGTYVNVTPTALTSFEKQLDTLLPGTATGYGQGGMTTVNPRFVKLLQGTYNLASGDSGYDGLTEAQVTTAIVGSTDANGGKTGIEALDDDVLNISIALAPGPGVGNIQAVQNGLITKAEATTNFLALVSPPYGVGNTGAAIEWSNGFDTARTVALNSSYGAIYWPWLKVFQVFDGKDRWLAPEIYGARQMAVTDNVADPWFAPAGFVRGKLSKPTDVEVVLNQGDRDSLYSGGNAINPVVNFPQNGIAIFGQRTSQRQPTALDRINVRRMMIYIKKAILASTQRLVFEPNDSFTWTRVQDLINPMLDDIASRRGITEFKVICDESTNTPVRVDRNEMWCKVLIKPTKTAEMVIFELNLTNQSAQLGS